MDISGQGYSFAALIAMLFAYVYTSQTPRASTLYQIFPLMLVGLFPCLWWLIPSRFYGMVVGAGSILVIGISVIRYLKLKKQISNE